MIDWCIGTFNENFDMSLGIGDLMLEDEEDRPEGKPKPKVVGALPELEGEETVADYLAKFKRACLGKKQQHRDLLEKLMAEKVSGHELLTCIIVVSYTHTVYIYIHIHVYAYLYNMGRHVSSDTYIYISIPTYIYIHSNIHIYYMYIYIYIHTYILIVVACHPTVSLSLSLPLSFSVIDDHGMLYVPEQFKKIKGRIRKSLKMT